MHVYKFDRIKLIISGISTIDLQRINKMKIETLEKFGFIVFL